MRRYALVIAALVVCATPLGAQGKGPKKYAVSNDRALIVTKEVLVKQGYEVVRVENSGRDYVVWYRRGKRGGGEGKGPPGGGVIHPAGGRVVVLHTPPAILVGIDGELKVEREAQNKTHARQGGRGRGGFC